MTTRDLLFKENLDLFQQNNESHTRESINSNIVEKAKIMSYEDIQEAQKKRDEKETTKTGRRGRKRKNAAAEAGQAKKTREEETVEAFLDIHALGLESYCSVF